MISLYIGYKDSNVKTTTFYLILQKEKNKIKIALPFKEDPHTWNGKNKEFSGSPTSKFSNEIMLRWRTIAMQEIRRGELEGLNIYEVAENIRKSIGQTKTEISANNKKSHVLDFYRNWAVKGTPNKPHPNRGNLSHCKIFEEYLKHIGKDKLTFRDVTYAFYSDFVSYLRKEKNYKENTVGVHIKDLKAVMNEAYKQKLHNNTDYKNFFKPTAEVDNVFFTEEEINRLHQLQLSSLQDKVRDIIILGCYVAQRHSDYSVITKDDIKEDGFIHITQRKGGNRIVIPVHPIVREILDKYNGYPPQLSQPVVNREIKFIAKYAGLNEKIQVTEIKGGEKKVYYKEKWEMVSTHTARRSGITNALLAGVPRQECMYLSGHKTESAFNRYVCITKKQYAEKLAKTDFFGHFNTKRERILDYVAKVYDSGENPAWLQLLIKEMGSIHYFGK